MPKKADSEPEFHDYNLDWPLDNHAEGIGSTGWDWVDRRSRWVGFDFDSISGHARGVGIDDEALEIVKQKATSLPYIEVRKSTGGKGLHLYVMFGEDGMQGVSDSLSGFDDDYIEDLLESAIRGREFLEEPINDEFIDVLLKLVQPTLWAELLRRLELEELEGSY